MSTLTTDHVAVPARARSKRALAGGFVGLVAAFALTLGVSTPSFAATGAQTGEWDVVATSAAQSPRLQSFEHELGVWDTISAPTAWFAVGAGKVIKGDEGAGTAVSGGGIRFENTAATGKTPTFTFRIPANVGLVITDGGGTTPVNVPASHSSVATVTWSPGSVAGNSSYHHHFDWTFSGSGAASAVNIPVSVSVQTPGAATADYTASNTYRFTF